MVDFNEIYNQIKADGVKVGEDFESQPPALDGQYIGVIRSVKLFDNEGDEKTVNFNIQIEQTISGNKGENRYISKSYNTGATTFGERTTTKVENFEKLLSGLKTMGLWNEQMTFASQQALLDHITTNAVGKTVNIRTRPTKVGGVVKRDKNGWPKQTVFIVSEFKLAPKAETEDKSTEIPF